MTDYNYITTLTRPECTMCHYKYKLINGSEVCKSKDGCIYDNNLRNDFFTTTGGDMVMGGENEY